MLAFPLLCDDPPTGPARKPLPLYPLDVTDTVTLSVGSLAGTDTSAVILEIGSSFSISSIHWMTGTTVLARRNRVTSRGLIYDVRPDSVVRIKLPGSDLA